MTLECVCDKCGKRVEIMDSWKIVGEKRGVRGLDDWSGRMDLCRECVRELRGWMLSAPREEMVRIGERRERSMSLEYEYKDMPKEGVRGECWSERMEGGWEEVYYGGWWECGVCRRRGVRVERIRVGEEVWWVCEECERERGGHEIVL